MRALGIWLAVAVFGCRSDKPKQPAEEPQRPPPADPCDSAQSGEECSEDLPVANAVALPGGRIRVVFQDPTDLDGGGARCRVVDYKRSGVEAIASDCCERGDVVAAALDERDRFYVLCADSLRDRLVARRLDADHRFHDASPTVSGAPADFGHSDVMRQRLLVANGSAWLVHDLSRLAPSGKDWDDMSYVQPMREGAKPIDLGHRLATAYVSDGALFAVSAYDTADDVKYWFARIDKDRVVPLDEPVGIADARCEEWHGTAFDGEGPLELHLMQYDASKESDRTVALRLPHGHAVPSATSRGTGPALCNGQWSRFNAPLTIGERTLTPNAATNSEALSCSDAGCVLVYVSQTDIGERFHVQRFSWAGGS